MTVVVPSVRARLLPGVAAVVLAAAVVYQPAVFSYLVDDDFHWLQQTRHFSWSGLLQLERYDHFYRPLIEVYFAAGTGIAGCSALFFHLASFGIHLANVLLLFLFARRLTGDVRFAAMAVALFAVQPAYVEAVAWVAAITDLLPALWYLLTLLLHLVFLQTQRWSFYGASLASFAACLLTHESSATLLPMMIALEALLLVERRLPTPPSVRNAATRYAPFAALLGSFLVIAYVVNSRSYLVREGYYAVGRHAIDNFFNYLVALYVGRRAVLDYVLIAAVLGLVLVRGTARMRFFLGWIALTLLPVLFFTWGITSRYLYVPAAGFALLLAEALRLFETRMSRYPARRVHAATAIVVLVLAARFAAFAREGAEGFREHTRPSERLTAALRAANPVLPPDRVVYVDARAAENVLELYRNALAEEAFCTPGVTVTFR